MLTYFGNGTGWDPQLYWGKQSCDIMIMPLAMPSQLLELCTCDRAYTMMLDTKNDLQDAERSAYFSWSVMYSLHFSYL